jgi:hypothetical protein
MHPLSLVSGLSPVRRAVNSGFRLLAERRIRGLERDDPIARQQTQLLRLVKRARNTRFGLDHRFASVRSVEDFQKAVPLRIYEDLWKQYLQDQYPIFDDLTWPGRIPYLALTSGTTQGTTKYIPVSWEMIRSNVKASKTMVAYHYRERPGSRLFEGKIFFLGGSTDLEEPASKVWQGDLSAIAATEVGPVLTPYMFPPLELALETNWDRKLKLLAEQSLHEPITMIGGVPSWLVLLFQQLLTLSGKRTIAEVWPQLEVVVHGGVKFDPYRAAFAELLGSPAIRLQEIYPCSEGFIAFGDPATGFLRLVFDHGVFYEFVPVDELESANPTRHWLGNVQVGVNYAIVVSTCAGMWSHIIGDTVRFESLSPPLISFTGRTKYALSAFGEHLISEEVEAAMATASAATGATVRDWHVGPRFEDGKGHHVYLVEFLRSPASLANFRDALDADLCNRNADYLTHREDAVCLPPPGLVEVKPGGFDAWMRSRGKLGGQHKLPRMDNAGTLTAEILCFAREGNWVARDVEAVLAKSTPSVAY